MGAVEPPSRHRNTLNKRKLKKRKREEVAAVAPLFAAIHFFNVQSAFTGDAMDGSTETGRSAAQKEKEREGIECEAILFVVASFLVL